MQEIWHAGSSIRIEDGAGEDEQQEDGREGKQLIETPSHILDAKALSSFAPSSKSMRRCITLISSNSTERSHTWITRISYWNYVEVVPSWIW